MTAQVRRIAALRALPGVGDLLCAVPALRALRAAHPAARVTLVGLASARWFVSRFAPLVDDLLVVEGVTGLPEVTPDPHAQERFEQRARARRFDLALQLHGSGVTSNRVLARLGARHQVGAHLPGQPAPLGTAIRYPEELPEIHRMLAVVAAAGCPPQGDHLELPLTPAEEQHAADLTARIRARGAGYACVHPGASRPERCWSVDGFAAVADHLVTVGVPVVLTGTDARADRVATLRAAMRRGADPAVCDLSGRTGLGVLGAVYRRARLVVTNDSGPSHVAAAVRTPSVVVGSFTEPGRWAPLDRHRHRTLAEPTPGQVLAAVDEQLEIGVPA